MVKPEPNCRIELPFRSCNLIDDRFGFDSSHTASFYQTSWRDAMPSRDVNQEALRQVREALTLVVILCLALCAFRDEHHKVLALDAQIERINFPRLTPSRGGFENGFFVVFKPAVFCYRQFMTTTSNRNLGLTRSLVRKTRRFFGWIAGAAIVFLIAFTATAAERRTR